MAQISNSTNRFGANLLEELRRSSLTDNNSKSNSGKITEETTGPSFMDHLEASIKQVNESQKMADKKATDLATGKETNIHETMLSASNAELTFNLMVQVRNKALEAYQEVMRMPI